VQNEDQVSWSFSDEKGGGGREGNSLTQLGGATLRSCEHVSSSTDREGSKGLLIFELRPEIDAGNGGGVDRLVCGPGGGGGGGSIASSTTPDCQGKPHGL